MIQQKKKKKLHYECAIFKQTVNQQILQYQPIAQKLNQNIWNIWNRRFIQDQWNHVFQHMIQSSVNIIFLGNNERSQIIKQIQHVHYTNLKYLQLSSNNIQNIEQLVFINCQNLQLLQLNYNNISQINCIKKAFMPSLLKLYLNKNPLIDISFLIKSKINTQLELIGLQDESIQSSINQDLRITVKLQCKNLNDLYRASQNRIKQSKVQTMFKARFPTFQNL